MCVHIGEMVISVVLDVAAVRTALYYGGEGGIQLLQEKGGKSGLLTKIRRGNVYTVRKFTGRCDLR